MQRAFRSLVFGALLATGACGVRAVSDPFSRSCRGPGQIQIIVENQNFNDMRLFSVTTRGRQLLGQVGGHTTKTFVIDWRGLDEIRLRMEFLAGDDYESNLVNASPGDRLTLTIPQEPRNSILRRR